MIVCHCTAVTDRVVAEAIAAGARDEFDVAHACGAGSVCGGCVPLITRLLEERGRRAAQSAPGPGVASASAGLG